jgi:hypothetical protein
MSRRTRSIDNSGQQDWLSGASSSSSSAFAFARLSLRAGERQEEPVADESSSSFEEESKIPM